MSLSKLLWLLLILIEPVFAQYEMKKHTINNGGITTSSGANYQLSGSIGQVDASNALSSGSFTLTGGFWQKKGNLIFKDSFE